MLATDKEATCGFLWNLLKQSTTGKTGSDQPGLLSRMRFGREDSRRAYSYNSYA